MKLIQTVTVGAGGAASIDFTSIPGTYTDLMIVYSLRSNRSASGTTDGALIRFNGSSAAAYQTRTLAGNGSSANSLADGPSSTLGIYNYFGATSDLATANTFGNGSIYIPNYAGSTNKSVSIDSVNENNATATLGGIVAGLWANTSAITSINLRPEAGTLYNQHSSASLYGILKGSGGASVTP